MSMIAAAMLSRVAVGAFLAAAAWREPPHHTLTPRIPSGGVAPARAAQAAEFPPRRFNLPLPTAGGWQFWADERICGGWRIQRHALWGRCRLLDPRLIRRAWGTYEECEAAMSRVVDANGIPRRGGDTVILLHGLFRTRRSMRPIEKALIRTGYDVVSVQYPSTRGTIEEHAAQLARVIERLPPTRRIHFVTHSLGGIVVRSYLRDHRDSRIGRLVMLAPPSRGSTLAGRLSRWPIFRLVTGPVGPQLGAMSGGGGEEIAGLPAPWCEFGVIAGGRTDERGVLSVPRADSDGILRVEETRLDGMKDFLLVPAFHTFIMNDRRVREAVVRFLKTGRFVADEG